MTLVSRGSKPIARAVNRLRKEGYDDYAVYFDKYGFVRVHYRELNERDIQHIRLVAYESLEKKSDKASLEDLILT